MKLTVALKNWAVENLSVAADAADDVFRKALAAALVEGTLTTEKHAELLVEKGASEANEFSKKLDALADGLGKLTDFLAKSAQTGRETPTGAKGGEDSGLLDLLAKSAEHDDDEPEGQKSTTTSGTKSLQVRVKEAAEHYGTEKSALRYPQKTTKDGLHPLAGELVKDYTDGGDGRVLESASERDKAVAGAFSKFLVARILQKGLGGRAFAQLKQHDQELLLFAAHNMKWRGASDGDNYADIKDRKLNPGEIKALIDDSTSGGLEAVPIVFDDMVIQTPLLYGELYPLVNTVPLDRGRRVEGVSVGTVTGSWNGVDATAITLFTTTSFVAAFDTTVFRWQGAIHIGRDFLADSPVDFGALVTQQYGERLLEDLDDVIATGNGTTQPEGVITKSGTTSVNFAGSTTITAYESLRFGVDKAEHRGAYDRTAVFCGTETSYARAHGIPVGASDARRLGGMDYDSYRWMNRPFKINESLTNAQIFYAVLGRYRMYRRRGLTLEMSTEGDTLIRNNSLLIAAAARYGGQLERGACAAVTTTAPA